MAGARPCWKYWLPSEARPSGSGGSVTATGPRLSVDLRAPDQRPSTGVIGRYFLCCLRTGYDDAPKRGAASVLVGATLNSAALATARRHCCRRVCSTASLNPATVGASTLSISSPLPASFVQCLLRRDTLGDKLFAALRKRDIGGFELLHGSFSEGNAGKSTKSIDILPLITVWLQASRAHQQINGLVGTISRTREATAPETQCFAPTIVRAAWYPSLELTMVSRFHRIIGGTVVRNGQQAICTWV